MEIRHPTTCFSSLSGSVPGHQSNCPNSDFPLKLGGLKISQKITLGYFAALGIAIVGTGAGIVAGDRFYHQASEAGKHALHEVRYFQTLQNQMVQLQAQQQQLYPFVKRPSLFRAKHAQLMRRTNEFKQFWMEFEASEPHFNHSDHTYGDKFSDFIKVSTGVLQEYFDQLEDIMLIIDQSHSQSAKDIDRAKLRLAEFANSPIALRLQGVTDELNVLVDAAYREVKAAGQQEDAANIVRLNIIGLSTIGSIGVAALLAFLISQAISRPIQLTTRIAQQVTQADNFDLQAPVTTQDEIGALTISLNELIQRVKQLLLEQKAAEAQLVHTEKMSSLGQLVAGVAHEINNPVNFVHGNLDYAYEYAQDLIHLLRLYQTHFPNPPQVMQDELARLDLEFLVTDLEKVLKSMRVGTERIQGIVSSLRIFSRLDEAEYKVANLHSGLDSTLLILQHRLNARSNRPEIQLVRHYGQIPLVECYSGQLNQVFMNLLANAIDAVEESWVPGSWSSGTGNLPKANHQGQLAVPTITIRTEMNDHRWVTIRIADNGSGMNETIRTHLFDPFFTTKPVGKGTGLGLYISYQIVVDKHNGKLSCHSTPGKGTEFVIQIPARQSED
ncbi:MAG: ATP-binding protein [Leptolyngbyaceae cyanobacterium bins.302]|nr:ATP-binding protein [Leptolyngbyaceae cyanobacterium bins.302]